MGKHEDAIIKLLGRMYRFNAWEAFGDFIELAALTVKSSMEFSKNSTTDEEYQSIIRKYKPEETKILAAIFGELVEALDEHFRAGIVEDTLGVIFQTIGTNNANMGQFFTPAHVATLCADMVMDKNLLQKEIESNGYVSLDEPSCGGGVMLLAFCRAMMANGFNPQKQLFVRATDLDRRCVCMTYLQLSLYGIPAVVIHGNTLTLETYGKPWYTPTYVADLWSFKEVGKCCQSGST